ncbi:unnamed protein product [Moneuplotes crassus]|uniref:Myb-like DNA-binding domain containing protein n=1 Tax=Euplotes crassus TaxID=5936 RepID=A0AAD1U5X5_EUPCR|nr:unnamed protein product [Moneuplotes crassus]
MRSKMKWTQEEDDLLIQLKEQNPDAPMSNFKKYFKRRSVGTMYNRWNIINPSFSKGEWDQSEKVQLFNTMFDVISANIETISQSLDIQRHKKDIYKQVYKVKEIAAAGYLGTDYEVKMDGIKPERRRQTKSRVKMKNEQLKFEDTYSAIEDIKNFERNKNSMGVKEELKNEILHFNKVDVMKSCNDVPPGLSRKEFLARINSLPSAENEEWTPQEDQNLLQLYQSLGSNWDRISLLTDAKNKNQIKERFCSLLRWGAYHFDQHILPGSPLESRAVDISDCVKILLKELMGPKKSKVLPTNISDSDDSNNSEFSY